ncbi:MAG: aspartate kinase [Deltaproteobacteria bacterium]|nr:aspartate kinase [Deltaproteobacteria bacterium]
MPVVVQKFGGSSVADLERLKRVARHVVATREAGDQVVVVVSAMGKTTDELLALARQLNPSPSTRELDMLLTVGERISMALLSMAIQALGHDAVSLTGSQSGIITSASHSRARIIEVRPFRVADELDAGRIVIVAGFQGTSYRREITTLGRGGSDTTAVALAAALRAERCEIYSDIEAVFTADPKVVLDAARLAEVTYEEMLDLSRHGAKVLNADAVEFARQAGIAVFTRSTFHPDLAGTVVRANPPSEPRPVVGVAGRRGVVAIAVPRGAGAGPMPAVESVLGEGGLAPDFVCAAPGDGAVLLVFPEASNAGVRRAVEAVAARVPGARIVPDLGVVTVVGDVLPADCVRADALACLGGMSYLAGIIATPTALSALVPADRVDDAVRALHAACLGTAAGSRPEAAGDGLPAVAADGCPALAADGCPAVAADGCPAVAADVCPAVAADGCPALAADGCPAVAADVCPAVAADGCPALAADGCPALAADGCPALAADGCPALAADGCPAVAADVCPAVAADGCPAVAADVCPAVAADVCPAVAADGCPAVAADGCPALAADGCPAVAADVCPAVAADGCPAVAADGCPAVAADGCPAVAADGCPAVAADGCPAVVAEQNAARSDM